MNPKVFKQAQSRGWMEGWEYMGYEDLMETGQPVERFRSLNPIIAPRLLSLNDILFGTDFCEKYKWKCSNFSTFSLQNCAWDNWRKHQLAMVYLSESERIAFLEKHLEVKEGQKSDFDKKFEIIKENAKLASNPKIIVDEPQPVEVKEIEDIPVAWRRYDDVDRDVEELASKIREIITQVNANTKAISACAKDCKLNRG